MVVKKRTTVEQCFVQLLLDTISKSFLQVGSNNREKAPCNGEFWSISGRFFRELCYILAVLENFPWFHCTSLDGNNGTLSFLGSSQLETINENEALCHLV